ncbi:hypothetical protein EDD18DRAFT_1410188 [Armillaria luteobubalina]|uniref:Uncharacterized protein n=1 Tax=Armillaria luteobubalina TaxID=153913 RepID=A0AA39PXJ1_9AGAR|nr:hypothetical protein EDD18DRAFT_1410188 [Armillaria luteobubalina]
MSSEQRESHRSMSRVCCCFVTSLSLVTIVPTLYITLMLNLLAGEVPHDTTLQPGPTGEDRIISLHATLVSANIRQSTMVVEWSIMRDTCDYSCPEVNIFFDMNLSPSGDRRDTSYPSNNRPTEPIFIWNATGTTSSNNSGYDVLRNAPRFSTDFIIYPVSEDFQKGSLIRHTTRAYYPFDWYWSGVTAFAQDTLTNKSVALALQSSAFRCVGTSLSNLEITTGVQEADPTHLEDAGIEEEIISAYVILKRSTLVIGYCLVITITFWLITLMICLITVTTVVFGYRQRNEIAVVPIGILFAFTQLRSTMPGAHEGFDSIGLLPCLVLLSICAVTMIGNYLFADPEDVSRKSFTWNELVNVLLFYIRRIWNTANTLAQRARVYTRIVTRNILNVIRNAFTILD